MKNIRQFFTRRVVIIIVAILILFALYLALYWDILSSTRAQANQYVDWQVLISKISEAANHVVNALTRAIADNRDALNQANQKILELTGINVGNIMMMLLSVWIKLLEWLLTILRQFAAPR